MIAELVLDCKDTHGEGIVWSLQHQCLFWTDIQGQRISQFDPALKILQQYKTPGRVCAFAPREQGKMTEIVAAFESGFAFLDLASGRRENIADIDTDILGVRMNDGRTDRQGRFIVGGMDEIGLKPLASVWRLDPDLSVHKLFGEVGCANGTCFSPDGSKMWFADSTRRTIDVFDYDDELGEPHNRRVVVDTKGIPDGSCVDSEGYVWNAVWEGHRVERYSPEGVLDLVVEIPVKKPTCCTFGGKGLETLFITSSRLGESPADLIREPMAGGLFAVRPGVVGIADQPFAG